VINSQCNANSRKCSRRREEGKEKRREEEEKTKTKETIEDVAAGWFGQREAAQGRTLIALYTALFVFPIWCKHGSYHRKPDKTEFQG
jgi:hypothetical protein